MASIGHVAVGLAAGRLSVRPGASTGRLLAAMLACSVLSLLPDIDVVAFALQVPTGAALDHRGATHSLAFALLCGVVCVLLCRLSGWRSRLAVIVTLTVASHGLLDAMTDGGLGVAFFWPLSLKRYFLPWRPLPVVPIGLSRLFRLARGRRALALELGYFVPLWAYALVPRRLLLPREAKASGEVTRRV